MKLPRDVELAIEIRSQPDEVTCGPTCLHALYGYYGEDLTLEQIIAETRTLPAGGTLAVFLACHALHRGYQATIYTYNLRVFDPTWFESRRVNLAERLRRQMEAKDDEGLRIASEGYQEFLRLGGKIRFKDLTRTLLRGFVRRGIPVITGLSATYLYRTAREWGPDDQFDDIRGVPSGHFVVLSGYRNHDRSIRLADPLQHNPVLLRPPNR
jgi:hypothetical protein